MSRMRHVPMVALVLLALAVPAVAQTPVTNADIQRLQDSLSQATNEVSMLRNRDASLAGRLQGDIEELREEVIYLKVKLRKERSVARSEYADVRDRIDDVRSRATATTSTSTSPAPRNVTPARPSAAPATGVSAAVEIPVGTELDVRLSDRLNSGTAKVEDRFEGTTIADLMVGGRVVIPAGSPMRGVVTDVQPGTRTNRTSKMTVSFDQVTINGRAYPIRATVTEAIEGAGLKGEAVRGGIGAAAGAIIGGILGGGKGAVLGAVVGGGGTIAATEGKEVDIPQGTTLRVRFDSALTVR
jgi:hypothetical protein